MANNKPVKNIRSGSIQVSIWENEGKEFNGKKSKYNTLTAKRSYKDEKGEWKDTESFRTADIPKLQLCLNKAYEYLCMKQEEADEDD